MKIDENLIPESEQKKPFKGDYYPLKISTAPKSGDRLLLPWKYRQCTKSFEKSKKHEYLRVQEKAKEHLKSDISQLLSDLGIKLDSKWDNFIDLEKCHKLGEYIVTDIYSNPNSLFREKVNSDPVYKRVKNCYSL